MQGLGTVQQKIPCLFVTTVREEPSTKRDNQSFRVLATGDVNLKALEADIHNAIPTEKVDGTCCYITKYKGVPYLWARLDRKPTKQAEKRYRKFQLNKTSSIEFTWNINDDFRTVPESWIPARGVLQLEGQPQPDENGHIPGWIPVEQKSRQYCWHGSAVNYETEVAMVMKAHSEQNRLEITTVHLMQLLEQTLELVGTHINGNPYGLGSKKRPVHALVSHGALQIQNPPALSYSDLITWFEESQEGKIEGIVWHCTNGVLIKLHRQHVGLQWPVTNPYLTARPVSINVDLSKYNCNFEPKSSFLVLAKLNGERFDHLRDIHWDDVGNNCTEGV